MSVLLFGRFSCARCNRPTTRRLVCGRCARQLRARARADRVRRSSRLVSAPASARGVAEAVVRRSASALSRPFGAKFAAGSSHREVEPERFGAVLLPAALTSGQPCLLPDAGATRLPGALNGRRL